MLNVGIETGLVVPKLISPNFSMIRAVCGVKLLFSLQYDSIITRNHAYILASYYIHSMHMYLPTPRVCVVHYFSKRIVGMWSHSTLIN